MFEPVVFEFTYPEFDHSVVAVEPVGLHALRCSTMLVNDEVASNNLAIRSVIVRPVIDAAALVILAPTGYTDSTGSTDSCADAKATTYQTTGSGYSGEATSGSRGVAEGT